MNVHRLVNLVIALLVILSARPAFASGSGMPWESALNQILESCTGTVAQVLGTLAIVGAGLGLAFGEGGGVMRKMLTLVFGLCITFTAASFGLRFFGFTGGIGF